LAGERTDRNEHQCGRHHGEREVERRTRVDVHRRVQPDDHSDDGGKRPQGEDTNAESEQRLERGRSSGRLAGEQEIPATTVLFTA
jgi:hypothetical protein